MSDKLQQDLADASLPDLEEMQKQINAQMEKLKQSKKEAAIQQIIQIVQSAELDFDTVVTAIRTKTKRGKAPALYRNPDNPRVTWSGKGEQPDWYKNHPNPEELRIPGA
jgi:DNA-binding protein H-NS